MCILGVGQFNIKIIDILFRYRFSKKRQEDSKQLILIRLGFRVFYIVFKNKIYYVKHDYD